MQEYQGTKMTLKVELAGVFVVVGLLGPLFSSREGSSSA
jgi:hypothetical protein